MSYGQLQEILEFKYLSFKVALSELSGSTLTTMIIDVPGEDDDISDDEDPLPHDLADSDVENLINDDDGVEKMADVARAHGGDGGGEDPSRPPPTSFGCAGCFINRGKGKRKPNWSVVKATGNPGKDPEPSRRVPSGQGEADGHSGSTYNLEPHMRSERWPRNRRIHSGVHLENHITPNKATLKREHRIKTRDGA
ncbi:hypothetical protein Tco_1318599 [Tanacetum coccineum]